MKTIGLTFSNGRNLGNISAFLSKYGKVRIIMPDEDRENIDMLVLYGEGDIPSDIYSTTIGGIPYNTHIDPILCLFYKDMLNIYDKKHIPIIGIQTGALYLAAYFKCKIGYSTLQHTKRLFKVSSPITEYTELYTAIPDKQYISKITEKFHSLVYSDDMIIGFKGSYCGGVLWNPLEVTENILSNLIKYYLQDNNRGFKFSSIKVTA